MVDREAHFEGVLHPDGRVEIRDLPAVELELESPLRVVQWFEDFINGIQRRGDEEDGDGSQKRRPGHIDEDDPRSRLDVGTNRSVPHPLGDAPILFGIGMRMGGLADIMLRKGQRRRTAAKQAFLDQVEPLREALRAQHEAEVRTDAQLRLGVELAAIWSDRSRSLAERKRALFERWDECDERDPEATEDDARTRGAERMRRRIEAFIRQVAPADDDAAFSPAELQRLNASRRSRQPFAPYAVSEPAAPLELEPSP